MGRLHLDPTSDVTIGSREDPAFILRRGCALLARVPLKSQSKVTFGERIFFIRG